MSTINKRSGSHFTVQEMKEISSCIAKIEEMIRPKMIDLNKEERDRLGESNKHKRLFVSKVVDYKLLHSELSSKEVDWDAFNLAFADKTFLRSSILCLQNILIQMDNTRLVYDDQNFKAALVDYENTRAAAEAQKAKYVEKYNELKSLLSEINNGNAIT